ncbi:MAG: TRAP transporter TatT component family protein [Desulfopila sp.]
MPTRWTKRLPAACRLFALFSLLFLLSSCSSMLTTGFIEPTVANMQRQTDLDLACQGSPAYLLMIDSLIAADPEDPDLLRTGCQAYSGYLAALPECGADADRVRTVAEKGHRYGTTLLAQSLPVAPGDDLNALARALAGLRTSQLPDIYWGTVAWLGWIQAEQGAPAAMADLVRVEKIMARLLQLDEGYQRGSIHLFFGAYYATRPPMLGGDPEKSAYHFQRALKLSQHRMLLVQTTYAETLARQLFDQDLYNRLLNEVLAFPLADAPDIALANQIAKHRAGRLIAEDYFSQ